MLRSLYRIVHRPPMLLTSSHASLCLLFHAQIRQVIVSKNVAVDDTKVLSVLPLGHAHRFSPQMRCKHRIRLFSIHFSTLCMHLLDCLGWMLEHNKQYYSSSRSFPSCESLIPSLRIAQLMFTNASNQTSAVNCIANPSYPALSLKAVCGD